MHGCTGTTSSNISPQSEHLPTPARPCGRAACAPLKIPCRARAWALHPLVRSTPCTVRSGDLMQDRQSDRQAILPSPHRLLPLLPSRRHSWPHLPPAHGCQCQAEHGRRVLLCFLLANQKSGECSACVALSLPTPCRCWQRPAGRRGWWPVTGRCQVPRCAPVKPLPTK